jgi:beta-galactosidase
MKRREFLASATKAALLTQFGGKAVLAEASRRDSSSARERLSIDVGWRFHRDDAPGADAIAYDDAHWIPVDLPHDWSILGPFSPDAPGEQRVAYLPTGIGWYRKTLQLPNSAEGRKVRIEFDGVYMNSEVWINGHSLGLRPYGYTTFEYDLTPYLHPNGAPNILAVRVDNSQQPSTRYYSGSGIYRHVWLNVTGPIAVDHWGAFVTTVSAKPEVARLRIAVQVRNESGASGALVVRHSLQSSDGTSVAHAESQARLAGKDASVGQDIEIRHPKLWSDEEPNMHMLRTTVLLDGKVVDVYDTPVGIREFEFNPDRGFILNGRETKLRGACMHHDLGALGAAFSDAAAERRLHILKAMGCNAIRLAHNPHAPQLLDLCDQIGFLVIGEAFDEWSVKKVAYGYHRYFKEWAERDLRDFVLRDRNHPSVIMWSLGNEIPDKGEPSGVQSCRMLADVAHHYDPTRPVTSGINGVREATRSGFIQSLDVVGYNGGGGSAKFYDEDHQQYPQRKIYGSEIPHTAQTRGVYTATGEHFTSYEDNHTDYTYEESWRRAKARPFVAGEFRWLSFDYFGEPTAHVKFHAPVLSGRGNMWPLRSCESGVIDMCGLPKDAYFFYQSQWTPEPMLHLLPHWTWPDKLGQTISVWCFTNCDEVELFVNEVSAGKKSFVPDGPMHLEWPVPYRPGVLRAIGRRSGAEVCRAEVKTAGKPAKIELKAEKSTLVADGRDVVYFQAVVTDASGTMVPDGNQRISFDVQGPAKLVGVDNGNAVSHESFQQNNMLAFSGVCIAIVRGTGGLGEIHVTATATGLETSSVSVRTRRVIAS